MKNVLRQSCSVIILLLIVNDTFAQTVGYVALYPGDNSRIVFQVKPDKNYTNVIAYINFYSNSKELLSSKGGDQFRITNNNRKWIKKNEVASKIFSHKYNNVGYVTLHRLGEQKHSGDESADDLGTIQNIKFEAADKPMEAVKTSP